MVAVGLEVLDVKGPEKLIVMRVSVVQYLVFIKRKILLMLYYENVLIINETFFIQ